LKKNEILSEPEDSRRKSKIVTKSTTEVDAHASRHLQANGDAREKLEESRSENGHHSWKFSYD